jgi:hypothetical protein
MATVSRPALPKEIGDFSVFNVSNVSRRILSSRYVTVAYSIYRFLDAFAGMWFLLKRTLNFWVPIKITVPARSSALSHSNRSF